MTLDGNDRAPITRRLHALDGNEAVASVAYRTSEVIAIYPITPASPMGEWADTWSFERRENIWGSVPRVIEMQSEAGAAGAVHGALQAGALATTFTASQGLLLMIPNMYKIAGELSPTVFHVAARSIATHALSIFGDHSDVMAARSTGFAMLASSSVQEAHDLALIAHAAALESRVPFLHFFDGFRTSHEIATIAELSDDEIRALISEGAVLEHRARSLSPDHPVLRGTAQNPDVFFQARERASPFHARTPEVTRRLMARFAEITGRKYQLFEYYGAPDADRVIVIMGSGAETARETTDHLLSRDEKVGIVKVRLFRPFDAAGFVSALPASARRIAVLDRTKEPGSLGEPLYLDCVAAVLEGRSSRSRSAPPPVEAVGGRYGLASKELTPAMLWSVFDELRETRPKRHFVVGIDDDVSSASLSWDRALDLEAPDVTRALFYGLGSDGTVGANKSSLEIIQGALGGHVQGYFVYDSKKAGAMTVSHLRLASRPIRSAYLITHAHFVACHHEGLLGRMNVAGPLLPGGTFLLNTRHPRSEVWRNLPPVIRRELARKHARLFAIDASAIAKANGLGGRINTVMQACFFAVFPLVPKDEAVAAIKRAIGDTYASKGADVVARNRCAVDRALEHLFEVEIPTGDPELAGDSSPDRKDPEGRSSSRALEALARASGDTNRDEVPLPIRKILEGRGDDLPVSAFEPDGTFETGTARYEKRNLADEVPVWEPEICIECGKCAMVCPHAALRIKVYPPEHIERAPSTFKSVPARDRTWSGLRYTIQLAPEDCTGCAICVDVCPAEEDAAPRTRALHMLPKDPNEVQNFEFFLALPEIDRTLVKLGAVRQSQVLEPLFEFSGACAGCGETPYLKLLSQLFGDRAVIANATGCSSIFGGNLPTTPWAKNEEGRGPAWSNSLFEDNAEFGLGIRLAIDGERDLARALVRSLIDSRPKTEALDEALLREILDAHQATEAEIRAQRRRVALLKEQLSTFPGDQARRLLAIADTLVRRSVWIVGGDGWAYDIGFGGLDHVLASGENVNVLVLDTEVYSNTGGQMSKSTPIGAVARFASGGKRSAKKDLGLMAMAYGNVYVASVAMGAKDEQTLRAFLEAESYDGPSLIIAYAHCIAHGIDMSKGMALQKAAVASGAWPLYRFHPDRARRGQNPLALDSAAKMPVSRYLEMENRFRALAGVAPETAESLFERAQDEVDRRARLYSHLEAGGLRIFGRGEGGRRP